MKSFCAAWCFLTRIPLPVAWAGGEDELRRSIPWFPVVGLLIGLGLAGLDWLLLYFIDAPLLSNALIVIAMVAISGGLHLDGLADSADGMLSSRKRERMLEIMKDSRVGVMGVLAIVAVLLLKWTALCEVSDALHWRAVLLMPLAGRCALVIMMAALPYARPEGGLATLFKEACTLNHALWATGCFAVSAVLLVGVWGLLVVFVSLLALILFIRHCRKTLGGMSGDTLGAACEILELMPALALVVLS